MQLLPLLLLCRSVYVNTFTPCNYSLSSCFVGLCMWILSHHATTPSPPALQVCVCEYFHTMQLLPLLLLCRSVYVNTFTPCNYSLSSCFVGLCMWILSHHATTPSPPALQVCVCECFHTMQLLPLLLLCRSVYVNAFTPCNYSLSPRFVGLCMWILSHHATTPSPPAL